MSSVFAEAGIDLLLRNHRELAAEVSIEQSAGRAPAVYPDRPLLWLSPGDSGRPGTLDGKFVASEAYAAARSIALLSRSPVLNRPSAVSACGTLPPGQPLANRRARHHDPAAVVRTEHFSRTWLPEDEGGSGTREVLDYFSGRRSFGFQHGSPGPFRHRVAVQPAELVKVRVVGDQTISGEAVEPSILEASRLLVEKYRLELATVWWLTDKLSGTRTLARIDCWMFDAVLGSEVRAVAEGLVVWVTDRLGLAAGIGR